MTYSFSVLTSTGYPYYNKSIRDEPQGLELKMNFYNFVHSGFNLPPMDDGLEMPQFELQAGLVSALYEFSRNLGLPIESLKYKDKDNKNSMQIDLPENSDVLITTRTEGFLNKKNYNSKIRLIYEEILTHKLPLGPEEEMEQSDEDLIYSLLDNSDSKAKLESEENKVKLKRTIDNIFEKYGKYGLEGIIISSFDGFPLASYNISMDEGLKLFRKLNNIPNVEEYNWEYRLIDKKGIYIINSGTGVKIKNLFMPFFYMVVTSEYAMLGDSPTIIYQQLNSALEE